MVTDYSECERLVRSVHALARAGRGDSPEAEGLRAQVESLLRKVDKADRERLEMLAERLDGSAQ